MLRVKPRGSEQAWNQITLDSVRLLAKKMAIKKYPEDTDASSSRVTSKSCSQHKKLSKHWLEM